MQDVHSFTAAFVETCARRRSWLAVPAHGLSALGSRDPLAQVRPLDLPSGLPGVDQDDGSGLSPLRQLEEDLASLFGAEDAWIMTGGASSAVLAAVSAIAATCSRVIIHRESHVSACSAAIMTAVPAVRWATAGSGGQRSAPRALRIHDLPGDLGPLDALFVTSPMFFGDHSDLPSLLRAVTGGGCPGSRPIVVVDQSWGPHYGLAPGAPDSAVATACDLVVVSLYKHLGSMTQTAALLRPRGSRLPCWLVGSCVSRARPTTLSLLQVASVAEIVSSFGAQPGPGPTMMAAREAFQRRLESGGAFRVLGTGDGDYAWCQDLRVFFTTEEGVSMRDVERHARLAGLELEWTTHDLGAAIVGRSWTRSGAEGYADTLTNAWLSARDERRQGSAPRVADRRPSLAPEAYGDLAMEPRCAAFCPRVTVRVDEAVGRIACEPVVTVPPGFPALLPGERVGSQVVEWMRGAGICEISVVK